MHSTEDNNHYVAYSVRGNSAYIHNLFYDQFIEACENYDCRSQPPDKLIIFSITFDIQFWKKGSNHIEISKSNA